MENYSNEIDPDAATSYMKLLRKNKLHVKFVDQAC